MKKKIGPKSVIVIGAGLGGLTVAALLAQKGHRVTVLEKNKQLGGRVMQFRAKGFTFDMGPSWFMMPEVFSDFLNLFGKKLSNELELIRLDPQYRVFFDDEIIDIKKSLASNLATFERLEKGAAKKLEKYFSESKFKYDISMKNYIYKNFYHLTDFLDYRIIKNAGKLHLFESWKKYVSRYVSSSKIQHILMYPVVFLGGSPSNTPALYSLLSHADFSLGVFYPKGGIYAIVKMLVALCREQGVKLKTNSEVKNIVVKNGVAIGVRMKSGELISADIIVSNADYPHTEMQLLSKEWRTYDKTYWAKKTLAPSAFIMYLGLEKKLTNVEHHNFYFSPDWDKHFDALFKSPKWPENPSYYFTCATKVDPGTASKGKDAVFVLVPIAPGLKDTQKIRDVQADKILAHMELITKNQFRKNISYFKTFSIKDYESLYNAHKGTALGIAHTLFQTAVFRPANKSKKVSNLYFTGQFTVPGIGLPMCIISGQSTAERIIRKYE